MLTKTLFVVFPVLVLFLTPLDLKATENFFVNKTAEVFVDQTSKDQMGTELPYWVPKIEDKARFKFEIPIDGLRAAVKYKDAGARYYLSDADDIGLRFSDVDRVTLYSSPNSSELNWFKPSGFDSGRYNLGLKYYTQSKELPEEFVTFGYTKILRQKSLLSGRIEASENYGILGSLGITYLNEMDTVQYRGWLKKNLQNNDYSKVALQGTFFDVWNELDISTKLSYSNEVVSLLAASNQNFGLFQTSIGVALYNSRDDIDLFLGVSFSQDIGSRNFVKIFTANAHDIIEHEWLDDLKSLRRSALMGHWQAATVFPDNRKMK